MSVPDATEVLKEMLTELRAVHRLLERHAEPPKAVLTRAEAAHALSISLRQLHRLIGAGRIKALPSGIARTEIERYVAMPSERLRYRPSGKRATDAKAMADRLRKQLREEKPGGSVQ